MALARPVRLSSCIFLDMLGKIIALSCDCSGKISVANCDADMKETYDKERHNPSAIVLAPVFHHC